LLTLEDVTQQMAVFQRVREKDLSVRQVERMVRGLAKGKKERSRQLKIAVANSAFAGVEDRLRQVLGTKVQVRPIEDGKGEIIVEYYSLDDLERVLELFENAQGGTYV
jgi:ParB family chromosome partitioning protein